MCEERRARREGAAIGSALRACMQRDVSCKGTGLVRCWAVRARRARALPACGGKGACGRARNASQSYSLPPADLRAQRPDNVAVLKDVRPRELARRDPLPAARGRGGQGAAGARARAGARADAHGRRGQAGARRTRP